MALRAETKTTFEPARVIQPFYTGGAVALSEDGKLLASTLGEEALITSLDTGATLARIEGVSTAVWWESKRELTLTKLLGRRADHYFGPDT